MSVWLQDQTTDGVFIVYENTNVCKKLQTQKDMRFLIKTIVNVSSFFCILEALDKVKSWFAKLDLPFKVTFIEAIL